MAFKCFDPRLPLETTRRNLPHWQQAGTTYFVTFRLADALPALARARLAELKHLNEAEAFQWIDRYLDAGAGSSLFAEQASAAVVELTLRHFDGDRYRLGAFVVMPNHVHALVQPLTAVSLTGITHTWKSYSAHALQRVTRHRGQVWQAESFDRIVRSESELEHFNDYILANPASARLFAGHFRVGKGSANWRSSGE